MDEGFMWISMMFRILVCCLLYKFYAKTVYKSIAEICASKGPTLQTFPVAITHMSLPDQER